MVQTVQKSTKISTSVLNIRGLDRELVRAVKVAAASEDLTIRDWVIKTIKEKLSRKTTLR